MRIVGGIYRSRTLLSFEGQEVRPTSDKVRESLFNILQNRIHGCKFLDLFCGTGAVSLEFLSRGAKEVLSVDNNEKSIALITKNFEKAKLKPNLIRGDFIEVLNKLKDDNFDYIFLDPPFDTNYGEKALEIISKNGNLNENGLIIYEHLMDKKFNLPNTLVVIDEKNTEQLRLHLLRRKIND